MLELKISSNIEKNAYLWSKSAKKRNVTPRNIAHLQISVADFFRYFRFSLRVFSRKLLLLNRMKFRKAKKNRRFAIGS
jgi:hypothetical protein